MKLKWLTDHSLLCQVLIYTTVHFTFRGYAALFHTHLRSHRCLHKEMLPDPLLLLEKVRVPDYYQWKLPHTGISYLRYWLCMQTLTLVAARPTLFTPKSKLESLAVHVYDHVSFQKTHCLLQCLIPSSPYLQNSPTHPHIHHLPLKFPFATHSNIQETSLQPLPTPNNTAATMQHRTYRGERSVKGTATFTWTTSGGKYMYMHGKHFYVVIVSQLLECPT